MTPTTMPRYAGLFPVVPTPFTESGELDLASQKRCVDFMIDAGSNGLCILANFSEQFLLADDERETLTRTVLEHVDGRVPVIVTTSHFSSRVCAARSRRAQDQGAAMVMVMPPYHGATFRVPEAQIFEFAHAGFALRHLAQEQQPVFVGQNLEGGNRRIGCGTQRLRIDSGRALLHGLGIVMLDR